MTREELFRAVGEVREDQIEGAETVKKQARPWRRAGALAACLAVIVTAAAVPAIRGQPQWKSLIYSFNPAVEVEEEPDSWKPLIVPFQPPEADSGGGAAAGGADGSSYWTEEPNRPTRPDWSTGVEIGELSGPGDNAGVLAEAACMAWLSPEEIFAQDTAVFRGTVQEMQYYQVAMDGLGNIPVYCTRAIVEVTDSIRGDLTAGERYSLLWIGAKGYLSTTLSGPLEDLEAGDEAVFMPISTDQNTGWEQGGSYFCYADLAEFYLGEGQRYVLADTAEGLVFDRTVYEEIADAKTLDEIAAYIREQIGEEETQWRVIIGEETESGGYVFVEGEEESRPASVPVLPQTEPSETEEAGPVQGPAGGLEELPGGAYAGEPGQ